MRRKSTIMFLLLLGVLLVSGNAYAISGVCSNCHTMHNSQGGLGEVQTYAGGSVTTGVTTPQQYLLKADCIACHTGSTATSTNSFGAPIVLHISNPGPDLQGAGRTLAGGDFYWVATGLGNTPSKGHNVSGLAAQEASPMNAPPGFDSTVTSPVSGTVGSTWASNQLSCAGTYGCHGQHNATGITGAHHGNTGGTATSASSATTVGNSYRFLGGIKGLESSQWNWNETATVHNEYYGLNDASNRNQTNTNYVNTDTISFSCAECHGFFHSRIDDTTTGTPWLRHPSDIVLPSTAGKEYSAYVTYSVVAPVARPTVPGSVSGTVAAGTDIVMCLSCHRAHGSPEPDLLRWTYSGMVAGSTTNAGTGCFTCHTTKDG